MLPFAQKCTTLAPLQSTNHTTDHMKKHLSLSAAVLGLFVATHATAATEHEVLMKAKKFTEAEKAAVAVLAQDPASADGLASKTEAIIGAGRVARIDEAVKLGKQCVATHAANARCQVVLGQALGMKAMNGGMMSAMSYAGDIRDAFKKAVELEPRNMDARFSLQAYYLMAPGIVGGGKGKAETLTTQTAALSPEAGKLMQAKIELYDDQFAKAEATTLAAKPGTDVNLLDVQEEILTAIGFAHLKAKNYTEAERVFNDTLKRFPGSDEVQYGQARLLQEQNKHREAIAVLEQVLLKNGRPYVQYRIAKSLLALGDKPKALAAFEKALAVKADLPASLRSDAEDQLKALKG